jgi:uncharacterized RDD family membrane protein YckC
MSHPAMSQPDALVTGDAVVLELRLAKLASRGLALAIDLAVQLTVLFVGVLVVGGLLGSADEALAAALGLTFFVAVVVGYPVAMETSTRGRSLGKLALGLRVVREDGGPARFRHAFVRALLGVVEIWLSFGSIALIASLASRQGRRLGDYLAGTVVVRERVPVAGHPVAPMPPPLAGWATGLDLSRLPDDLALAARQFLTRAGELSPAAREDMGSRIATAVAAVTAPPPPPGTPPWAFLAAVLAERRRRELARMGVPAPGAAQPFPAGPAAPYAPPVVAAPYAPLPYGPQHPDAAPPPPQPPDVPPGPFAPPA